MPNTQRTKIIGDEKTKDLNNVIELALKEINQQKVERHGDQIVYLVEHIVDSENPNRLNEDAGPLLEELIAVTEETRRRMKPTKLAHTSTLCNSLLEVAKNIRDAGEKLSEKDVKLLHPIAQSIQVGFSNVDAAKMATSIADTVSHIN